MALRVGFEIHQQLDTRKLFCPSPSLLREEEPHFQLRRRLRPAQSELGAVDEAARKEFLKGKEFIYRSYNDTICLVELDEEPPRGPEREAVEIALTISLLLNARVVDEIHFMRKIVIDGSNTTGFQRTAIVALDGYVDTDEGRVRVPTICLEEEAARKVSEDERTTTYSLDRLGIPLIEISTAPDITSPRQAREVALRIGELLRATGRVRRGIGTIRQDINVSIEGGARVEIKGVQDLNLIPRIIEAEAERQRRLLEIAEELRKRGAGERLEEARVCDVTELLKDTGSKVLRAQLKVGRALALKLPLCRGLLGGGLLGRELARYVAVHSGLRGIFHSDELPGYGISQEEVEAVERALELEPRDAFVLVAGEEEQAYRAIEVVLERARLALNGPVEETRVVRGEVTEYMRPLPGAARMYPETDIPPFVVTPELLSEISANLPEDFEAKAERLAREYGLTREQAGQVARLHPELSALFEACAQETRVPRTALASIIVGMRRLFDAGVLRISDARLLLESIDRGAVSKEAAAEILEEVEGGRELQACIEERSSSKVDLNAVISRVVEEKSELIRQRGLKAEKALMGLVMREVRGRVDGRKVHEELRRRIEELLSSP